jgi:hypothetical protein
MKAMPGGDHRIAAIREAILVNGRWGIDVEKLVCDAIESAYDDGVRSAGKGHARFRLLRWIARHEGETGWSHRSISEQVGTARETISRQVSILTAYGVLVPRVRGDAFVLSEAGRRFVGSLDSADETMPLSASGAAGARV